MSGACVRRLSALALAALCLLPGRSARAAEEGAGTRAASFLSAGGAPAVLAMGGATLALGRDLQGAAANPAALGWVGSSEFTLAHAQLADQTAQEWAALGGRLGGGRTRYGLVALFRDEGTIAGRDENDAPTGDFKAQDFAFALQVARPFGEHVVAGGAARYVGQRLGEASGSGLAFDAGAQLRLGPVAFAVAGQNFGGGMSWQGQRWRMPANLGAGLALEHAASGLRLALDWNAPADYYRNVRAGAEWRWRDRVALRGGWRGELGAPAGDRLGGPAFGFGARAGAWWLDYGYVLGADGTSTHRMGLTLRVGPHAGPPAGPHASLGVPSASAAAATLFAPVTAPAASPSVPIGAPFAPVAPATFGPPAPVSAPAAAPGAAPVFGPPAPVTAPAATPVAAALFGPPALVTAPSLR